MKKFDAIVIGGGHAGIEAAFALANKKYNVALISLDINRLAMMPCNPSIGGPAKGILTKEIDALGGMQGIFADQATIQIKMLNQGKGPAVRALRAQIDKDKYSQIVKDAVLAKDHLTFIQGMVDELIIKDQAIVGLKLANDEIYQTQKIIVTTGTYMNSFVLQGQSKKMSGPDNQATSLKLSQSLKEHGLELQRLKTGTPPRVYASSIDFSQVEKEEIPTTNFSFSSRWENKENLQISCYLTYTNQKTHQIVEENLTKSSMYSGAILGVGPRYCPSIEDKIVRFKLKERHQIFYEPETAKGDTIYVQGFSTSMPVEVQEKMLKTLPGMANAKVKKWGYAIEYDAIDPLQLKPSLEVKKIRGLYFAGQINGTSGYEEAAAQGLMAGINVALALAEQKPLVLTRNLAYIGVLIDDLVTKGTREPYRMLTSRAEFRLLLRHDNADKRLSEIGYKIGLISQHTYQKIAQKYQIIREKEANLRQTFLSTKSELAKKYNITSGPSLWSLLKRPEINYQEVYDQQFANELAIQARLEGYIKKQEVTARKMLRLEQFPIPNNIKYDQVLNLATEARQKLKIIRPKTIGQASRISGINPADIQMLMFHLEFRAKKSSSL